MRDWEAFVRSNLTLPDLPPAREARIVRELASQLEDVWREGLARGASDEEADRHACAQIADWPRFARDLLLAERVHARAGLDRLIARIEDGPPSRRGALPMIPHVLADIRYAVRQLRKAPGFAAVAIIALALGIGASSAVFTVVNGVLLRPLPYEEGDRLVMVVEVVPQYGRFSVAPANFLDWRRQASAFVRIAAFTSGTDTFIGSDGPERIAMAAVSWDIFHLLGVQPMLGRAFEATEDAPGKNAVVLLSHGFWQRRFGGDAGVLGRPMRLGDAVVTIVGVMPPDFVFPNRTIAFWRPIALDPSNATRGGHYLGVVARLAPGVSLEEARTEMKAIAQRLAEQYPASNRDESAEVVTWYELIVGPVRPLLLTLLASVAVVVLIACVNVANLLLVRASVRERELAIRAAVGAGRGRILSQILAESLLLAVLGGAAGLGLAWLSIGPIRTLSAGSIPRVADLALDGSVLAFALALTLATTVLAGAVPAWQASRGRFGAILREGGRSSTSARAHRLRAGLLVAEVALSIVLVVGAMLLLRSFAKLTAVEPGFDPDGVLAFGVSLPQTSYPDDHHRAAFYDRLLEGIRAVPGVQEAGMTQTLPMRSDYMLSFSIEGRAPAPDGRERSANYRVVSPGYFTALGIPVVRGRAFTAHDTEVAPMVAVVDEAFARTHFGEEDPIGHAIDIGNGTDGVYRIVGIVGSVRHEGLAAAPRATMYVPYKQDVFRSMWLVARTQGDPMQLAGAMRRAVGEIDPALPAFAMTALSTIVSDSVAQRRFSLLLLMVFALVALLLAAVGLYGVVAYTASRRTQEIGLRMALGAQGRDVMQMILAGGMKLAVVGLAAGLALALALGRFIESLLFGVTPFDPLAYAVSAGVLLATAGIASYVPARRAMAVDPLVALRQE